MAAVPRAAAETSVDGAKRMRVKVRCPYSDCQQHYRIDDSRIGTIAVCKQCGRSFAVGACPSETIGGDIGAETRSTESPAAPSPTIEAIPRSLGRFRVSSRLGTGAFGAVYRGYDPLLGREVAIKVPRVGVLNSPEAKARFLREPKAAAHLRHPRIVPVYEAGSEGDQYYIAAAFIEGITLEELIEKGPIDFARAVQMVRDLAEALHYAHGMGVVHRDVKPANIMLDDHGQVMLTDFGLARLQSEQEQKLTQDGTVMGTPAYMAPEQADAAFGAVGPASDQYGLGVVCYELLCGTPPFSGPPAVVIFNALNHAPDRPRLRNPAVPKDLETICLKAISKHPEQRYRSCEELAEDLRRWQNDEPIRARRQGLVEQTGRWMRRNPLVASLIGMVLLITALGLSAVTWQWRRAEGNRLDSDANRHRAETALAQAEQNAQQAQFHQRQAEQAQRAAEENLAEMRRQKEEAERQRLQAAAAHQSETAQRARADEASQVAQAARQNADESLEEVKRQRLEAQQYARIVRRHLYAAEMNLAMQAWEDNNLARAEELLEKQIPPSAKDEDLRAFEWYYLAGQVGLRKHPRRENPADVFHHRAVVYRVVISPAQEAMISLGRDKTAKLWDIGAAVPKAMLTLPKDFAWGTSKKVTASDEASAAVAAASLSGGQWRAMAGTCTPLEIAPRCGALAVATSFEADGTAGMGLPGKIMACKVKLWQVGTQAELPELQYCGSPMAFSPDDKTLAVAKMRVVAINLSPEKLRPDIMVRQVEGLSPEGIALVDTASGQQRELLPSQWIAQDLCYASDGQCLAVAEREAEEFHKGTPLLSSMTSTPAVVRNTKEPDQRIRMVHVGGPQPSESARTLATDKEHTALLKAMSMTAHGETLAWLQENVPKASNLPEGKKPKGEQLLQLYNVKSGTCDTLSGAAGNSLQFSPDGCWLVVWTKFAIAELDEEQRVAEKAHKEKLKAREWLKLKARAPVLIWDVTEKRLQARLSGHRFAIRDCAFSPDSSTLATASEDGTIKLWDTVTGAEKFTLKGHEDGVLTVAFSADGRGLISGGRDGTLRLWHAEHIRQWSVPATAK